MSRWALLERLPVSPAHGRIPPWWLPWGAAAATALVIAAGVFAVWEFAPWAAAANRTASPAHATAGTAAPAAPAAAGSAAALAPGTTLTGSAGAASGAGAPTLAALLAKNSAQTDPDSAFAKLFGLWGAHYSAGSVDPCTQATQQGLECFVQHASFAQLRLYNRPAILMITDDAGAAHHVVMTGLDDEHARLELAGTHDIGIAELARYWYGDFVLLWRPGVRGGGKVLSLGMRGADVRQLRESLERLRGANADAAASDVFDEQLGAMVRDFQRSHRLTVDGVAGVQTLVVLNGAIAAPNTPLLAASSVHGG